MKKYKTIHTCQNKPIDNCCFMEGCGYKCGCDITEEIIVDQWLIDYQQWLYEYYKFYSGTNFKFTTQQLFNIWFKEQKIYTIDEINSTNIQK